MGSRQNMMGNDKEGSSQGEVGKMGRKRPTTIYLCVAPPPPPPGGDPNTRESVNNKKRKAEEGRWGVVVGLRVRSMEDGVDLGAIWRALVRGGVGVLVLRVNSRSNPRTLRLNGHFVSSGVDGISTLTWRSLTSFFHSRGHPSGLHPHCPIHVTTTTPPTPNTAAAEAISINACQGKGKGMQDGGPYSKKRRNMGVQEEQSGRNKKPMYERQQMHSRDDYEEEKGEQNSDASAAASVVDCSILWIKRKLNLDDDDDEQKEGPHKKRIAVAQVSCNASGAASCAESIRLFALPAAASTSN